MAPSRLTPEPPTLGELGSLSPGRRAAAIGALGDSPAPEHAGALCGALSDPAALVRLRAVEALVALAREHPRARGTIRRVLARRLTADPSAELRRRTADALAQIDGLPAGGRAAAPALAGGTPRPRPRALGGAPAPAPPGRRRRPARAVRRPSSPLDELFRGEGSYVEGGFFRDYCDNFGDPDYDYDRPRYDDEPPAALPPSDGLAPLGAVESLVARWADVLHPDGAVAPYRPQIAHLLDAGARARLRALVRPAAAAFDAPPALRAFLRRQGLGLEPGAPVATLPRLALSALLRHHGLASAAEPAWGALGDALLAALRRAPPADEAGLEVIVLAAHEAFVEGPLPLRRELARAAWHDGWAPLAAWPLSAELGGFRARARGARGSWLAQRNLREEAARRAARGERLPGAAEAAFAGRPLFELLAAGGGSLRSLDYPEFRVVGRAALVELGPEQELELAAIAEELARLRAFVSEPARGLEGLFTALDPELWPALDAGERSGLLEQLGRSAQAYAGLRRVPELATARLRRSHLVDYWRRPAPRPHEAPEAPGGAGPEGAAGRALEGLVAALLGELHQPRGGDEAGQHALKELLIEAARVAASCYAWQPLPRPRRGDLASTAALIDALLRCFDHAPRELLQALGACPRQGLPRLQGGRVGALEGRFRRLHREALRGPRQAGEGATYLCKPLPKTAALGRGELGRDCSSNAVPLRALSPHHVYYGLFDGAGRQLPGYLTVFEAWAASPKGPPRPALCLETINEPTGLLGGVQQDLLVLFEGVARARGLGPGLVLVTGQGTWNYANGAELARCRRVREAEPVRLSPADPITWRLYEQMGGEASYYSAFDHVGEGALLEPDFAGGSQPPAPLLAPFDPARDCVQPENLAEARRLASLPPRALVVTCRDERGAALGFVSG